MTDTTDTVEITQHAEDSGAEPQPLGMLEHFHPNELQLGENVRDAVDLGKDSWPACAAECSYPSQLCVRISTTVVVRNGQRRMLGAREVALPPSVYCRRPTRPTTPPKPSNVSCTIVTNDQKIDLTDAQRACGIQQMIDEDFGNDRKGCRSHGRP